MPCVFPQDHGPGCVVCRGNATSALALLVTLQSAWREQSVLVTLVFWIAAVKAFKSGQVDVSEGDVEDAFSPWV